MRRGKNDGSSNYLRCKDESLFEACALNYRRMPTTLISEKRKLTRVGQSIRGDDIGRLLRTEIASEDIPSEFLRA